MDYSKYIEELLKRTHLARTDEQETNFHGYTYRLYGKYPYRRDKKLPVDAEKLAGWANTQGAFSYVVMVNWCRRGIKPYALIVITDPVAPMIDGKDKSEFKFVTI